jgi:hypothetical protein
MGYPSQPEPTPINAGNPRSFHAPHHNSLIAPPRRALPGRVPLVPSGLNVGRTDANKGRGDSRRALLCETAVVSAKWTDNWTANWTANRTDNRTVKRTGEAVGQPAC